MVKKCLVNLTDKNDKLTFAYLVLHIAILQLLRLLQSAPAAEKGSGFTT